MILNRNGKFRKIFGDASIRSKLLFSYIMLIFTPLIFLVVVSWGKISSSLKENMYSLAVKSLEQSKDYLEYKLGYITNISDIIILDDTVQAVLTRDMDTYRNDFLQQVIDADKLTTYFNSFENSEDIEVVRLYVPDVLAYAEGNRYFLNIKTASQNEWFRNVLVPGQKYHWFPAEYFTREEQRGIPVVCLLRRIIDQSNYRNTLGVLRVEIRESVFSDIISKANITDTGLTLMINSNGELITYYGNSDVLQPFLQEKSFNDAFTEEKQWSNISIGAEKYVATYTTIAETDWKLITVIPQAEILEAGSDIRNFMLILMAVSAIVAYITAYSLVNLYVNRIKILGSNMHKVKAGDFSIQVPVTNNDEIGILTQDFNYMVKEMDIMIKERFSMGKQLKNLELKALQAQINPHFLYNSLDMINWTASINGLSEIATMVQALAKFYKLSLSKGAELISIRNEIEHVKAYITIQNLRYDNAINFVLDIDEQIYDYYIIKIVLQPIVENAILHGILKKSSRKGTITISGRLAGNRIIFTVKDDGAGMDSQMIENILNNPRETNSYGIRNINERLALHYGPEHKLVYRSEVGQGTEVTIDIPAIDHE